MTRLSKIRGIKERETANDVLFTPLPVAMKLIEMTEIKENDRVLDPCRGEGAFSTIYQIVKRNIVKLLKVKTSLNMTRALI